METSGGGWALVASNKGTGNWMNYNSNLNPEGAYGTYSSTWDKSTDYYIPFKYLPHDEILLKTGQGDKWCILPFAEVRKAFLDSSQQVINIPVLGSFGTGIKRNGIAPIQVDSSQLKEPWIGCENSISTNQVNMLWGEDNAAEYVQLKNSSIRIARRWTSIVTMQYSA